MQCSQETWPRNSTQRQTCVFSMPKHPGVHEDLLRLLLSREWPCMPGRNMTMSMILASLTLMLLAKTFATHAAEHSMRGFYSFKAVLFCCADLKFSFPNPLPEFWPLGFLIPRHRRGNSSLGHSWLPSADITGSTWFSCAQPWQSSGRTRVDWFYPG